MPVKKDVRTAESTALERVTAAVDFTLLKPAAGLQSMLKLCDRAVELHTASVCIPPAYVRECAKHTQGKIPICTVTGFPIGYGTLRSRCFETAEAVSNGASEIDTVINLGLVKEGLYYELLREINEIKNAANGRTLKVIVEASELSREEKLKVCEAVSDSNADFIKTSTGFFGGGASFEDVKLFAEKLRNGKKIKAAGGIRTLKAAEKFLELGAERLGISALEKIIKEAEK